MDQEFRAAIRAVQRAGKGFSDLALHDLLDKDELQDLIHHCVIARLRQLSFDSYVVLTQSFNSDKGYAEISKEVALDSPKLFIIPRRRYWEGPQEPLTVIGGSMQHGVKSIDTLPQAVTHVLQRDFWILHLVKEGLLSGPQPTTEIVFQKPTIAAYHSYDRGSPHLCFYLADIYVEKENQNVSTR